MREPNSDFFRLPLWVRAGTLLATSARHDRPDHDTTAELELQAFELGEDLPATARVHSPDGRRQLVFEAVRQQGQLRVRLVSGSAPTQARYTLVLKGGRRLAWSNPEQALAVDAD